MFKLLNTAIVAGLFCFLSACASVNTAKTEEQEQKIKTAKINAQLGIAYLERHNLQRSKQKLLLALEQGPNIPEPWYSMAYFLEATGNKDDASIYYQKAISVAPTRGDAQNNYGTFLCRSGEYRAAVEHFMLAVKDPTYLDPADAYENAGLCALKIPDKAMASKYFSQALQQDPSRTVSERKLRDLNKYLAMNKGNDVNDVADESASAPTVTMSAAEPTIAPPPKRIAYNSLKHRHEEEENEDEAESGLVKVPDLLKARPVMKTASAEDIILSGAAAPTAVKAVYTPALKHKAKLKVKPVTAQVEAKPVIKTKTKMKAVANRKSATKAKSVTSVKSVAMVNPLTKEKFHMDKGAARTGSKKKVALKAKHGQVKASKMAANSRHKQAVASAKSSKHRVATKHVPLKGVVTV